MSFQNIPTEIATQILGELGCSSDRSAVSKSCKRFRDIVQPYLYSEVMLKSHESTSLLLRSILHNHSLAGHIKSLDVRQPAYSGRIRASHIAPDWPDIEALLEQYLNDGGGESFVEDPNFPDYRPNRPKALAWLFKCWDVGNWGALTAAVLTLLPSLERLNLSKHEGMIGEIISVISAANLRQLNPQATPLLLPNLAEINLGRWFERLDGEPFLSGDLVACLRLRSLRKIVVNRLLDDEEWQDLGFTSQVQYLTLKHSCLAAGQLERFLENCVGLKELYIGHLMCSEDAPGLSPMAILRSLTHLYDCLESLTMIEENSNTDHNVYTTTLPRMNGFNKLHTIEVTAHLLFGKKFLEPDADTLSTNLSRITDLPKSITFVTLRKTRADMIQHLVISESDMQMLNLKKVHVQFQSGHELDDAPLWLEVARSYQKRNIILSYNFYGQGDKVLYPCVESNE